MPEDWTSPLLPLTTTRLLTSSDLSVPRVTWFVADRSVFTLALSPDSLRPDMAAEAEAETPLPMAPSSGVPIVPVPVSEALVPKVLVEKFPLERLLPCRRIRSSLVTSRVDFPAEPSTMTLPPTLWVSDARDPRSLRLPVT